MNEELERAKGDANLACIEVVCLGSSQHVRRKAWGEARCFYFSFIVEQWLFLVIPTTKNEETHCEQDAAKWRIDQLRSISRQLSRLAAVGSGKKKKRRMPQNKPMPRDVNAKRRHILHTQHLALRNKILHYTSSLRLLQSPHLLLY
jgi:hypothetical protein